MLEKEVARRYALALFTIAQEKNEEAELSEALQDAINVIYGDEELKALWEEPRFSLVEKKRVLEKVLSFAPTVVKNFLSLLLDKGRTAYLLAINEAYNALWDEARGLMDAVVETAKPLNQKEKEALTEVLERRTGKTIRLEEVVDPSLLAGVRVRYADYILDGTAKIRLQRLTERLAKNHGGEEVYGYEA